MRPLARFFRGSGRQHLAGERPDPVPTGAIEGIDELDWTTRVRGWATDPQADIAIVELVAAGIPIRSQRADIPRSGPGGSFEFFVAHRTRALLPANSQVEVRVRGFALPFVGEGPCLIRGYGDPEAAQLRAKLDSGFGFDHWGDLHRQFGSNPQLKDEYIEFYGFWRGVFEREFNLKLFLVGGNLLGVIRNGDFLDHDDDLDVGYMIPSDSVGDVLDHFFALYDRLFSIAPDLGHRLAILDPGHLQLIRVKDSLVLDVFACWLTSDGEYCRVNAAFGPYGADSVRVRTIEFRGVTTHLPEFPERALELEFGPSWRIPDRHFVWRPSEVRSRVPDLRSPGWSRFKARQSRQT